MKNVRETELGSDIETGEKTKENITKFLREAGNFQGRFTAMSGEFNIPQLLQEIENNSGDNETSEAASKLRELAADFLDVVLHKKVRDEKDLGAKLGLAGVDVKFNYKTAQQIFEATGGLGEHAADMEKLRTAYNEYWQDKNSGDLIE